MKRTHLVRVAACAAVLAAVGVGGTRFETRALAQGRGNTQVPNLEVDRLWPQPFPAEKLWAMGSVTGVAVDAQDHVWVSNRGLQSLQGNEKGPTQTPWASQCCFAAPQILEFDPAGKLLNSWGGPGSGYDWPQNPSGIAVDGKGNVWLAGAGFPAAPGGGGRGRGAAPAAGAPAAGAAPAAGGRGPAPAAAAPAARGAAPAAPAAPADAHVIKFSRTGQSLLQIGKPGQSAGPDSQTGLNGPTAVAVDDAANEVYVADSGNRRVVVFDATTGAYKRHWFGSGDKTSSPAPAAYDAAAPAPRGFRDVSCVKLAKDGMVYVCDSASNRVQVFQKNGTFVKEGVVKAGTGGMVLAAAGGAQGTTYSFGSVWDVAFSNDAQQRFLYVADGMNKTVWVLDRSTLTPASRVGDGGRYPGLFYAVGSVAVDSKGNLYTGEESDGKRVQRFVNRGMGAPRPLN